MSNARFSIIPAWIITDKRLKHGDLRVVCLLGTYTNKEGWCRRSQVKMAEQLGCGRSTVQDALNRLSCIGAVEKRVVDSPDGRDSAHWYRVILDRDVTSNAFAAYDDEDDKEFGPISSSENSSTPAGEPAPPAGEPAPPAGPGAAPPAGPGPAPINDHSNDSSNDSEKEGARNGSSEDRKKVERDFKRWFPIWPTYLADSENAARKAWFDLSASDRTACLEKTDAYIVAVRDSGRTKWQAAGVYLTTKAWEKLADPRSGIAPPSVHEKFSRPWMALRLAELLKPMATTMPALTIYQKGQVALGGEAARRVERERNQAYGWPRVNTMDQSKAGATVPAALMAISEDFSSIPADSDLAKDWRELHDRMNWPWVPDGLRWLQLPAGRPEDAMTDFQSRLNEGNENDAA